MEDNEGPWEEDEQPTKAIQEFVMTLGAIEGHYCNRVIIVYYEIFCNLLGAHGCY